ncbi:hypothetical protein RclHR1_01000032 [Rhizophagus clarus]|nr:hypothetical protein RclHR1_01000032 [Rhizophagus clarus]
MFSSLRSIHAPSTKLKIFRTFNVITLLAFFSLNVYSLVISPSSIDICNKYPTYFTPSLIFVGIFWSILFFLQFSFTFYAQFNDVRIVQEVVGNFVSRWFYVSNLFMCGWLFFWMRESFILSGICVFMALTSTAIVQNHLTAQYITNHALIPTSVISFIHIPFSMFAAFSFFLLFHNGFVYLSQQGYEKNIYSAIISASFLTIYSILWCTTGIFSKGRRDFIFSLTIAWSLLGVSFQQKEDSFLSDTICLLALSQLFVVFFIIFKNCSKATKNTTRSGERESLFQHRMNFYGGIIVDNWYKPPINDDQPAEVV